MDTVTHGQKITNWYLFQRFLKTWATPLTCIGISQHLQKTQQDAYEASTSSMLSQKRDPGTHVHAYRSSLETPNKPSYIDYPSFVHLVTGDWVPIQKNRN